MTMLDELLDELRRRGWPEPATKGVLPGAVYWSGRRSILMVMGGSVTLSAWYGRGYFIWDSAMVAADELDRLRARLAPGEIPCLDLRVSSAIREVEIDGIHITGPDA